MKAKAWKRALSKVLALMMALSLAVYHAYATEPDDSVAQIGDVYYSSLKEAIADVPAGTSADNLGAATTITILKDVENADGVSIPSYVNLTIDFNGHTYVLGGAGAGSAGTETSGFQLLKDSTIVMKNGTVKIAEGTTQIKRIIQSYANLTLEDMTFYSENQAAGEDYCLSFNNGTVTFKGNTSVISSNSDVIAFDVYYWASSYPNGTTVIFDESYTGSITGQIVYDTTDADKASLSIAGTGTFGGITLSSDAEKLNGVAISLTGGTYGTDPSAYVADGYEVVESGNNTYTVTKETTTSYVASVTSGEEVTYYETVAAAITAASEGNTVTLLADVIEDVVIDKDDVITLDLNGMTLTNSSDNTITNYGTLTIMDSSNGAGIVNNVTNEKGALVNYGTVTLNGGTFQRSKENSTTNAWYTIKNYNQMTINDGSTITSSITYSSCIANGYYDTPDKTSAQGITGNVTPTLTINGGTISGGLNTVKNDDYGVLVINGGTFTNSTQDVIQNHSTTTINGGTFTATGVARVLENCGCDATSDVGVLTITGGTFTGDSYVMVLGPSAETATVTISNGAFAGSSVFGSSNGATDTVAISGGHFSNEISADMCAKGYEPYTETAAEWSSTPYTVQEVSAPASVELHKNMTLGNSLAMNFLVLKTDVNNDITGYTLTVSKDGGTAEEVELVDGNYWAEKENFSAFGSYYMARYTGCYAYEYATTLTATLTDSTGKVVATLTTSISSYLNEIISGSSGDAAKTMAQATLDYCAAAKVYYEATT